MANPYKVTVVREVVETYRVSADSEEAAIQGLENIQKGVWVGEGLPQATLQSYNVKSRKAELDYEGAATAAEVPIFSSGPLVPVLPRNYAQEELDKIRSLLRAYPDNGMGSVSVCVAELLRRQTLMLGHMAQQIYADEIQRQGRAKQ